MNTQLQIFKQVSLKPLALFVEVSDVLLCSNAKNEDLFYSFV